MPLETERTFIRSGGSFARGTTIDEYLSEEDNEKLYQVWEEQPGWPEIFRFRGGQTAITAEMILEVPEADMLKAFRSKFGRKKVITQAVERIQSAAARNAG